MRTKQTLFEWLSKKSCTLHELQSLIGTLQFACCLVMPGRAFLQCMINLTRHITKPHHIKLNSSFRKDIAMWLVFLEQWNGTNVFLDIAPTNSPKLEFSTDASGSLGYGAFFNNFCFQGNWSRHFHTHKEQQSIHGKSSFLFILHAPFGGTFDLANISYCGGIMSR